VTVSQVIRPQHVTLYHASHADASAAVFKSRFVYNVNNSKHPRFCFGVVLIFSQVLVSPEDSLPRTSTLPYQVANRPIFESSNSPASGPYAEMANFKEILKMFVYLSRTPSSHSHVRHTKKTSFANHIPVMMNQVARRQFYSR
jgi:hypothetical protein